MTAAIAVLGGGITGLSAAWHLARRLPPAARLVLVEGSPRLGGWVRTDRRRAGGAEFLAEKGPRTLRGGDSRMTAAVLELVDDLDLRSQVLAAPRLSPAARNRYIYYGGELNCMPRGLGALVTGLPPAVKCLPRGVWRDLTTPKNTPAGASDESIHSFVSRRFGEQVDDNLASAVMHGIYAADTKDLSARALLYPYWLADRLGSNGVIRGLRRVARLSRARHAQFAARDAEEKLALARRRAADPEFWDALDDASMFSFRDGLQALTDALGRRLAALPNVEVVTGQPAAQARTGAGGNAEIALAGGRVISAQHVVNTLPLPRLRELFAAAGPAPLLDETPYASVAVVNVAFGARNITPVDGFGFLVPRAAAADTAALGAVFDSCVLPAQDGAAAISRLTVMLGGARLAELAGGADAPPAAALEDAALESLRTVLGIRATPIDVDATVQAGCIPSYTVGYVERLKAMHEWVGAQLGGRMSVVGAAYGGPAVPQCILHARDLAHYHLDLAALDRPQRVTGLEEIIKALE
ncbi:oxygen-dependent protoporphyrinogen oxidase [Coemansia javaensis]|uniref:Protoporphyrinogen oxidase n=1 Tax=Coemansia javaensis TaxID=2761396 RepID=A0A9W8HJ54_9FUNG|nr:oxygen-dependent protoporphyrinogen oxidase [Coemansia javaensis]